VDSSTFADLSVDEIQEHLAKIEKERQDLEKALERRWQQGKEELARQIRQMIDESGHDLNEIVGLLGKRRKVAGTTRTTRQYTRYVDPENPENVYVRGVLPGWMKEKMQAQGYDPSVKEDREAFKQTYLQALDG
jgi:DNA-binding protein H-NS